MNYEIHITVEVDHNDPVAVSKFKQDARVIGVKGIVLDAHPLMEVMTSYRMVTDDQNAAFKTMTNQLISLVAHGYKPLRSKVETDLNNPAGLTPLPNQYFEAHIQLLLSPEELVELRGLQGGIDFYLSRNVDKPLDTDGRAVYIITIREYHTLPFHFSRRINAFVNVLGFEDFKILEVENEFALYDSNPEHDQPWFKQENANVSRTAQSQTL